MKKTAVTLFFLCACFASAWSQRTVISKEQTMRAWMASVVFRNVNSQSLGMNAASKPQFKATSYGIPKWVVTKNPHKIIRNADEDAPFSKGNVKSEGYPAWTISKGVHRTRAGK